MIRKSLNIFFVSVILVVYFNSCIGQEQSKNTENPIVSIGDWTLTDKQIRMALPIDASYDDSITLTEDYIGRWIRTKLFLYQAEVNLSPDERNIQELLDEYRTTLLVHLYQQKMLEEKHQPIVSKKEIEDYYLQMSDNFKLQENIVRGVFLIIDKNSPNQKDLKKMLKAQSSDDLVELDAYAFQYAKKYDQFIEDWTPFSRINIALDKPISNEALFLKRNDFYESSDSLYNYYFVRYAYHLRGEQAPLSFVDNRIEAILLNKKRVEFINKLGEELYEEAIRNKIVHFY